MTQDDDFPVKNKKKAKRRAARSTKQIRKGKEIQAAHRASWEMREFAMKHVDNLKSCCCWMCQNPRKVFKGKNKARLTMQERKSNQKEKDE